VPRNPAIEELEDLDLLSTCRAIVGAFFMRDEHKAGAHHVTQAITLKRNQTSVMDQKFTAFDHAFAGAL
jgi:hypothetical protein